MLCNLSSGLPSCNLQVRRLMSMAMYRMAYLVVLFDRGPRSPKVMLFPFFPNSPLSFSSRMLFKLLNDTFFCKSFLQESCFKKIILIHFLSFLS